MRRSLQTLGLALVLSAGTAGCSDEAAEPAPVVEAPAPSGVSLSFVQQRVDELGDFAQLRVVNESDQALQVDGVGLDWPGYAPFVTGYDTVVEPGRVLDLRFEVPAPDCAAPAEDLTAPVVGRLRLDDGTEIDDELDESGTGYVTRIRQRRCDDQRVADAVRLTYGPGWRVEGSGRRSRLVGPISLTRTGPGAERVTVEGIAGSVLLRPVLPRPLVLPAGRRTARTEVSVVVPRCDEHALTESSQTFGFKPTFGFGSGPAAESVTVLRVPDARTRQAAQRYLRQACVVDGSAQ